MADILRIIERFKITDKDTIYTIETSRDADIRMGRVYEDLRGNRFKVKAVEMLERISNENPLVEMPLGLMFELIDEVEPYGNILVKEQPKINFLFCNHPLNPKRVDEEYETEYQEASSEHSCALFSYEDLQLGKLLLYGEEISGLTIYRGWMMKPELYQQFYKLLEKHGIILINSPDEYKRYHTLPGWYEDFKEYTAESIWETSGSIENILYASKGFKGSYIVKDFVKSRKHEWYDACYIKDISDNSNAARVISNFVNRQGEDLVGGIVLRKFEKLKQIGFHEKSGMPISEEYRVFIFAGQILIIDDYWREGESVGFSADEQKWIKSIAFQVKSNFVTMDIARKEDGSLIIMEFGDGQVSGIQQINPARFYFAFEQGKSILVEKTFPNEVVILASEPMPNKSIDDMRREVEEISSAQELADAYANVHNKFWFIEDDLYDYDENTPEYKEVCEKVDSWGELMDSLTQRIIKAASDEGLLAEHLLDSGIVKQLEPFMSKYGYRIGSGWWVEI